MVTLWAMSDDLRWESLSSRREPPPERPPQGAWGKFIAPVIAGVWAIFKFGAPVLKFFVPALKFLPMVFKTGGSMLLSIAAYAWMYGWQFAVGFVLLLFVHEIGHSIAAKAFGLRVSAPVFIPFLGAQILLQDMPKNAWVESIVGIGGPVLGTIGGLVVYVIGLLTGEPLFFALASSAFFLNLFNLVPILPLDGGRVVTAISPWLWVIGIAVMVPYLLLSLSGAGIYILILVAMSLPRVWRLFRSRNDPEMQRYYECEPWQRVLVTFAYFGLVLFLGVAMTQTHKLLGR